MVGRVVPRCRVGRNSHLDDALDAVDLGAGRRFFDDFSDMEVFALIAKCADSIFEMLAETTWVAIFRDFGAILLRNER